MFLSPKKITFLLASFFVIQLFSQTVDEEVTQLSEVVLTGQSPIKQVLNSSAISTAMLPICLPVYRE